MLSFFVFLFLAKNIRFFKTVNILQVILTWGGGNLLDRPTLLNKSVNL